MNKLLVLAFLFFVASTLGWVLELIYRRFVTEKKWINPGFLTGPYLPIYGFGICILFLLGSIDFSFIENEVFRVFIVILFMCVAMTLMEYIAGMIFIKGMKIKLWDYSDDWGNINGIICPGYTFYWALASVMYYFLVNPHILEIAMWLKDNLIFSFISGFFLGIVAIDFCHSMNIMVKLKKFAEDNKILVKYEELKAYIRERQEQRKERIHYVLPFRLNENLDLKKILEEYKEKISNREKK